MNGLTSDFVAIDTNIFMHLMHDGDAINSSNAGSHIDGLLDRLQLDGIGLLVDSSRKIAAEYLEYIVPILDKSDEMDLKRYILTYWMNECPHHEVTLDRKSRLFVAIKNVIHESSEECDRIFVCVAFEEGRCLITNDSLHILFGPTAEKNTTKNNRYTRLLRETKKLRQKSAEILSSKAAFSRVQDASE